VTAAPAPRILVLEDDPAIRDAVVEALSRRRYAVVAAATVDEFRRILDSGPAALALLDRHVRGEDSAALVADIATRHPHVPVVVMSSDSSPESVAHVMGMGAKGFLGKPFPLTVLVTTVEGLVARGGQGGAVGEARTRNG
jgi:two-component system nitrogen regulation response regulator GlnG